MSLYLLSILPGAESRYLWGGSCAHSGPGAFGSSSGWECVCHELAVLEGKKGFTFSTFQAIAEERDCLICSCTYISSPSCRGNTVYVCRLEGSGDGK